MNREMIKKEVILPKLNDCRGDLSRQWFVYYSVFNPATGKMQTFRDYKGFAILDTVEARKLHSQKVIKKYRTKLLNGWNPFFEQDKVKYASLIRYDTDSKKSGAGVETTKNFEFYSSRYLNHIKFTMNRRPATYTSYKSKLRIFGQYLKEANIDKVSIRFYNLETINNFNKYLQENRGLEGKILNDYNQMLKTFFKHLIQVEKIITSNPVTGCHVYDEKKAHHKALNDIYIEKLRKRIEPTDPSLWMMCRMIFNCFTRPNELRFLQLKHIDWIDGTINLPAEISKNRHDRTITIPQYLLDMLIQLKYNEYPKEYYFMSKNKQPGPNPVSKNYLYNHVKKHLMALNMPKGFTLYSFKHTGVQRLAKSKVDLLFIKAQLGHASLDQMIVYVDELLSQGNDEIRFDGPKI